MSDPLSDLYNACDPLKPATADFYVDSDEARGSLDFSLQFLNELKRINGSFLTRLFTGHLGCGKSSELHHLAERLRNPSPVIGDRRYFPIILDAEQFVDTYDVTPTDVLLSVLARVAQELEGIGIKLQDHFLWRRLVKNTNFLKEFFLSEIEVPKEIEVEKEFPLAKVTARFGLLKSDPTNRQIVREALGRDTSQLKLEIQLQLEKARGRLQKQGYSDFVLILDNLEKINRVQGLEDGYQSHRQFFIESASQLTNLGAHVVYTVPLPLVIRDGRDLATCYGTRPFVLPMIKIENRPPKRGPHEEGRTTLRKIIEKRAGGRTQLDKTIAGDALNLLVDFCGGHTRQLITSVRYAASQTAGPLIALKDARRANAEMVALYATMPRRFYPKLAELELHPYQDIDSGDPDIQTMLEQLIVLEYRNGNGSTDDNSREKPWYAVHPVIRTFPAFLDRVEELKKTRKTRGKSQAAPKSRKKPPKS